MADGGKGSLEIWLDFAKALVWPAFAFVMVLILGRPMLDALRQNGGQFTAGSGGLSLTVQAQQRGKELQAKLSNESKPDSPSDPPPSAQAISQIQTLNALQTLAQSGHPSTRYGWIYCGPFAQGHWTKPPNLKVKGPILQNQTYSISTDTYLRENPPQDNVPKGQVIGIVPQGQEVKVLDVSQVPDKEQPDSNASLIWVRVENKDLYGMRSN
jgi:hypothetical protein